jgi:hypothetical protein
LINNIQKAAKAGLVTEADIDNIKDESSLFSFLTDPLKGGLTLNRKAENDYRDLKVNINSNEFRNRLKILLPDNFSYRRSVLNYGDVTEIQSLNNEDIKEQLRSADFNNTLKFIELFKSKQLGQKFNIVSTTHDSKDNSMPTMSVSNLASLVNRSIAAAPNNSFFKENSKLLLGVEVLSEVENNGISMEVNDLTHVELFKYSFLRNFLMSGINEDK